MKSYKYMTKAEMAEEIQRLRDVAAELTGEAQGERERAEKLTEVPVPTTRRMKVTPWSVAIPAAVNALGLEQWEKATEKAPALKGQSAVTLPVWVDSGEGLKALHVKCNQGTEKNLKAALYKCVAFGLLVPNRRGQLITKATNDARTQFKLAGRNASQYRTAWMSAHSHFEAVSGRTA